MAKILLAEDDATMVSLLKTLLKMEGHEVRALDSDADIVSAALKQHPDLLMMDVHLLHQDGIELLSRLRADPQGKHIRVLMTSGLDFKEQCLKNGADGFIQKPFMPDDLLAAIDRIAGR